MPSLLELLVPVPKVDVFSFKKTSAEIEKVKKGLVRKQSQLSLKKEKNHYLQPKFVRIKNYGIMVGIISRF